MLFYSCYCIFLHESMNAKGTKACVKAADLIDLDGNMHWFKLPLSSVFSVQDSSACSVYEHTAAHILFLN